LAQFPFRLKPVFAIVPRLGPARDGEVVGARRNLHSVLFFKHKEEVMVVEMTKPLIPPDWAEPRESWEIESDTDTPVVHSNRRRP
jgi:hypothetical protein